MEVVRRGAFVARERELAVLERAISVSTPAEHGVVVVHGEAGIGKSALIRRWLSDLNGATTVLRASGDDGETTLDYGVLSQLVPGDFRGMAPLAAGAVFLHHVGEQADGPVAVVIDDAPAADDASLQALTFAARRFEADRVTLVVVSRTEDLRSLPRGLLQLADEPTGISLELRGLGPDSVRALAEVRAGRRLSAHGAQRLCEHTAGNPLHVLALLRELDPDRLDDASNLPLPAPSDLGAVVLARLASCPPDVQVMLVAAAVLGTSSPLFAVLDLAGVPASAVDAAIATGLVHVIESGGQCNLRFCHALYRAAIYLDLGPSRRAALHHQAARVVSNPLARVRHRIDGSLEANEAVAAEAEATARRLLVSNSWAPAGHLMASAARLSGDEHLRLRRCVDAVDLLLQAGDVATAARVGAAAEADTSACLYVRARLDAVSGQAQLGMAGLLDAWRLATDSGDVEVAARAAESLSMLLMVHGRATEAAEWSSRARPDRPFSLGSTMLRVMTLLAAGRTEQARALVAPVPSGAGEMTPALLDGIVARGIYRLWTDDAAGAAADLRRAASGSLGAAPAALTSLTLTHLADAEYRAGHWDDALHHAWLAVATVVEMGQVWVEAESHAMAAVVLAGRGDLTAAEAQACSARTVAEMVGDAASIAWAAMAGARIAQARGDGAGMLGALAPLQTLGRVEPVERPGIQPWLQLEVEGLVGTGRLDEATRLLDRLEPLVRRDGLLSGIVGVGRARADIALRRGDPAAAADIAARTLDEDDGRSPFETALLRCSLGAAQRRAGHRRDAATAILAAREALSRLGAQPFLVRCDEELAALGMAAPDDHDPLRQLTPQERSVAGLAAGGLSNREIAERLIVSVKTVEYHLGHVYMKLGLRSRGQLAGLLHPSGA